MADLRGTWDARYDDVAATLAASLDAGTDVGASVAVLVDGEPVVDIWGGSVDEAGTAPWERDTITNVWGGFGGSLVVMDQDARITICYVMNRMEASLEGDLRGANIMLAAVTGLAGG